MNRNIIIVLAGGFLIALLVAIMMSAMLNGSKKEPQIDTSRVEILVAAKDLQVGRELKEEDLKWQVWPEDSMFGGAVIRDGEQAPLEAVQGKLLRSVSAGQPMHISHVIEDDAGDFLSANVAKGKRAVGISVRSHVLADRLVRPGDYVDVMVTYRVRVNTRNNPEAQSVVNRYATETVIKNVRVLAIDKEDTKAVDELEEDGKKKKKRKSSKKATLTLEVSPEQGEKLVLADRMGNVGIALRSIGDNQDNTDDQTTTDVGLSKVMTKLSTMKDISSMVKIYNGNAVSEVRPRRDANESTVQFDIEDGPEIQQNIYVTPEALQELSEEQ